MTGDLYSASGLVGGDAAKLRTGPAGPLAGTPFRDILARALACRKSTRPWASSSPHNGRRSRVCCPRCSPTRCRARHRDKRARERARRRRPHRRSDRGTRLVVWCRGRVSGRDRCCSAMAAGAATEMLGGSPSQVGHATALAMQGTMGLVCDPLGDWSSCLAFFATPPLGDCAYGHRVGNGGVEFKIPVTK